MTVELKVPDVGESITEVYIGQWLKEEGDEVQQDENIVELESEKATFEAPAPASGVLAKILKEAGETAQVGEIIAEIEPSPKRAEPKPPAEQPEKPQPGRPLPKAEHVVSRVQPTAAPPEPVREEAGRAPLRRPSQAVEGDRQEETVPMSPIRRRIAERLVEAQRTAALLTTFNEIDMSAVQKLRRAYGPSFREKFGIKLGIMSFFVKAAVDALAEIPQVNAEIRGHQIVYRNYYDIGIAIGGGKGLVVPVLRNAERMSFAEIEQAIDDFARRARENKLDPDELRGGTFTISNGGIYGSLLSTPIVNPPQSGVLGMHAIQDRPVVREGQIVVRPMMYVALTYDHRLIDGREAVTFLRRIKEVIEEPTRLVLEV